MTRKAKDKMPVVVLLTPKWLVLTGKIFQKISIRLTVRFAIWLFTKTLRYPLPKRELEMYGQSKKYVLKLQAYDEKIRVYEYGVGQKKILLVHGWAGSGTQLATIATRLVAMGYGVVSFDAPGHGKAPGNSSMLPHFVAAILELEQRYGSFGFAIGHSLGGMALLRAVREGLVIKKLLIIGAANSITKIIADFARNMQLNPAVAKGMKRYLDHIIGADIDDFSGAVSAKYISIPTCVIHDQDDIDVSINAAYEIHDALSDGELYITKGLGHRKILGNRDVVEGIINFIQKEKII